MSKITGNEPAFAKSAFYHPDGGVDSPQSGLTIRQYYAGLFMAALISDVEVGRWIQTDPRFNDLNFKEIVAMNAIEFSDALITELNKLP